MHIRLGLAIALLAGGLAAQSVRTMLYGSSCKRAVCPTFRAVSYNSARGALSVWVKFDQVRAKQRIPIWLLAGIKPANFPLDRLGIGVPGASLLVNPLIAVFVPTPFGSGGVTFNVGRRPEWPLYFQAAGLDNALKWRASRGLKVWR